MEIPKKPPGSFRPRWVRAACDGTPRDMAPRQPPGISPDVQGEACVASTLRRSSPFARHRRKSLPPNGLLMGIAPPIGSKKIPYRLRERQARGAVVIGGPADLSGYRWQAVPSGW